MRSISWLLLLSAHALWVFLPTGRAQSRPYLGYVYPAGGQQGTTFQVKIGGQNLNDVCAVLVSGTGVTGRVVECCGALNNRESGYLSAQLRELNKLVAAASPRKNKSSTAVPVAMDPAITNMIARIKLRLDEDVRRPACNAFRSVVYIEVTVAPDAPLGERELRLVTPRGGASNPMPFYVGQLPEHTRKPMLTAPAQVLGKEHLALRKRPASEAEVRVNIPCTLNGQIASREVNSYRFSARKGQRLVITTLARQLIPYIADGVPGWFQPVIALYDADGNEIAYDDDYRFKPDPVILCEVPKDGEYVLQVHDAIYRGRNDFVYRITIGEQPFVTSIFPLGARVGESPAIKMQGWNLAGALIAPPPAGTPEGIWPIVASRNGQISNPVPFALDTLPECVEQEPNDTPSRAQKITLPILINGRIGKTNDVDTFQFNGRAGDTVVVEVYARRLDSPLDSVVQLTDAHGQLVAFNDDCEDLTSGLNTHHADSYLMAKLPTDGSYYVRIADTGRYGGDEYGYRLRISPPRPDFALRVAPSSAAVRPKSDTTFSVYVFCKDGFSGDIKLELQDPPAGFTSSPATLTATQMVGRVRIKASATASSTPVNVKIVGSAVVDGKRIVREAVPAEDRMQAFLWRHLVPAKELKICIANSNYQPPDRRVPPPLTPEQVAKARAVVKEAEAKGRAFTKNQVAGLGRLLKSLYERGLLTDKFYGDKMAELGLEQ